MLARELKSGHAKRIKRPVASAASGESMKTMTAQTTAPMPSRPSLVSALPVSELSDQRGPYRVQTFRTGEAIYSPNDPADRVFLLRTGRVRLMRPAGANGIAAAKPGDETADNVHALLRAGDLFGDVLRPVGAVMEEFAIAQTEAEVWIIESRDMRTLLEARPTMAIDLIRGLSDRARSLRRRVQALTFKEVPARLAESLLVLGETHGERCTHGGELDLRGITQQDLADLVGASRSFVSTLVNEMKRDGLLSSAGRILCIRNQRELRRVAAKDRV